ncbi:MAG: hypothetical protein HOG34_17835 [Bacteroidetes bacterium]|jgi:hypothetical protein|nr:hypothetical protein [Bacteroidota bacterium]MBT4409786.1 hypothetical protein [Bacteroidota bacterium]
MNGLIGLMIFLSFGFVLMGQETAEGPNFPEYPLDKIDNLKGGITLPLRVDNSTQPWFPPVFNQYGWSCNQASSVGYLLTYELNRQRNLIGDSLQNQYPPLYVWNFLNSNSASTGVSYFDSWEIIKANGCPNYWDYPYWSDNTVWMSGYDKYLRAMQNKVINNYSISVSDVNGLRALKTYLFNHNDGYPFGGLANFQIGSGGMQYNQVPDDSYDAGKVIITRFGDVVGHAMTIVGYNDDVKYDYNGDGIYTNHIDLNGDGLVDLNDYEIGALIVINSWGDAWGNRGKAYVPYRLMAKYGYQGGFWNRSVHVIDVLPDYHPVLTMKLELVHTYRNMIKISAGVSSDPEATQPDYIHNFPLFHFQGGSVSLGEAQLGNHMEIGLDITPLLSYIESDQITRFFVLIDEDDPSNQGNGLVYNFELVNYENGESRISSSSGEVLLLDNQTTIIGLDHSVSFSKVKVRDYPVQYTETNQWMTIQLQAEGISGPGRWEIVHDYTEDSLKREFPEIEGMKIPRNLASGDYYELELPFDFPFYGENFRNIYIDEEGLILLETEYQDYPYAVDPDLSTKQRKSIIPFGHDLSYFASDNRMHYHPQDSVVTVFWDAMASVDGMSTNIRVACSLYPDGLIEFHYSDYNLLHPTRISYLGGLSKGDGKTILQTSQSSMNIVVPNQVVRMVPFNIPGKTKIEANGLLFCRPEEVNTLYQIKVKVTDNSFQEAFGIIPVSTLDFSSDELTARSFPNPFSDKTRMSFIVQEDAMVTIEIFDHAGRKLRSLIHADYELGQHSVDWDGNSEGGNELPSGIYYGRILLGEDVKLVKMMKVR